MKTLTKTEAIEAMENGAKVGHPDFTDEYMYMSSGLITTTDGFGLVVELLPEDGYYIVNSEPKLNTPWEVKTLKHPKIDILCDCNGHPLLTGFGDTHVNRFIVTAVNNHHQLVEALKELLECDYASGTHLYSAQVKARKALSNINQ